MKLKIGEIITEIRLANRLSRNELSALARISYWKIYMIETGKSDPKLSTLQRLFKVLGADLEVVLWEPESEVASFTIER